MEIKRDVLYSRNLFFLLLGTYILSLFLNINLIPLKFEEPRRALVALEMMISGNYIVPKINGTLYLNKLPMFNWVLIALFKLTGSLEEWVVRLPTILSFLGVGGVIYWFVNKYNDRKTAFLTAFFWLTSVDIYFHFSILGEIDVFYSLLVVIQVVSIFYFYKKGNYLLLFIVSYLFMAVGILTKGLPSIAFQAMTLFFLAIFTKNFKKLFTWQHLSGIAIALAILGGYFALYAQHESIGPMLIRQFTESTDRTAASKKFLKTIIHLFTFPFDHIKLIMPWGLFLLLFFNRQVRNAFKQHAFLKFSLAFVAINIIPYWISPGTKDRYLYMFIPFLMVISAWAFIRFYQDSKWKKWIDPVFLVLIILLSVVSMALPFIRDLSFLANIKWLSYLFMILFFICLWFYFKRKEYRIWIYLFTLVFARLLFDVTVIPARKLNAEENKHFEQVAKDAIEKSGGQRIYLLADSESYQYDLPVLNEVSFDEVQWPDFSLSFYYSKYSGEVLSYVENPLNGNYYFVLEEYYKGMVEESDMSFTVLESYYIPERDQTYLLIAKNKDLQKGL